MNKAQRETEVVPFTNGSAADWWQEKNCDECQRFTNGLDPDLMEDMSGITRVRAGCCQLAHRLSIGYLTGTIPAKTAKRIGATVADYSRQGETIYVHLPRRCAEFIPA